MNSYLEPYPKPVPVSPPGGSPNGGPLLTIYVANMAEDVWQLIETLPPNHQADDIRGCDLTSDRELSAFLNTPNFVLVSPVEVDPNFISYIQNLEHISRSNNAKPRNCGVKSKIFLEILVPRIKTGQISLDILNDPQIIDRILSLSQKYNIRIESYTASSQFIDLVTFLKGKDPTITAPLTPDPKHKSVVDHFGSKSGLRSFYEQNHQDCPDFMMAEGKVCANKAEAFAYAKTLYESGEGVVFKTPKGHSGIGVVIIKKQSPSIDFSALLTEPYWDRFPVIVEQYHEIDYSIGGGNPNAECLIDENGQTKILFYCGMRVDKQGSFQGMEIGPEVLPQNIKDQITSIGKYLSDNYIALGYKGYFDIDGIINHKHELLIAESNVRRTGGTHIYYLALALLGKEVLAQKYLVSNNYYSLPKGQWNFSEMYSLLQSIIYNPASQTGLVITGANTLLDNFLSYAIIANNKSQSLEIESQLKQLIASV